MGEDMVLVVLAERPGAEAALHHAARAAEVMQQPHIVALHVRVDPMSTITPTEELLSEAQVGALELEAAREGEALHSVFEAWSRHLGRGPLADWRDVAGTETEQVRRHAEAAALLVMTEPTAESHGHARQAFHAALFDTGRPLLTVPAAREAGPVRRIMIGWKSGEASRKALRAAAPWLRRAPEVLVVRVGVAEPDELAMAEQELAGLGVRAAAMRAVPENGLSDGERLLAEAETAGADWLVMGAYRHGRLIEWVMGGVTRTVLREARLPVFLVH